MLVSSGLGRLDSKKHDVEGNRLIFKIFGKHVDDFISSFGFLIRRVIIVQSVHNRICVVVGSGLDAWPGLSCHASKDDL